MRMHGKGSALRRPARLRVFSYMNETCTWSRSANCSGVRRFVGSNFPAWMGASAIMKLTAAALHCYFFQDSRYCHSLFQCSFPMFLLSDYFRCASSEGRRIRDILVPRNSVEKVESPLFLESYRSTPQ